MEHRHEWRQSRIARYGLFFCSKCGSYMEPEEAKKRINAVEFLSAEDAELMYQYDDACFYPGLLDYAKTLRGE